MDIEVDRGDLGHWRTVERDPSPLAQGEARLRIDRFGFSSNNVTYAVLGHLFHYRDYFRPSAVDPPDRTPWGRVPAWGFAEVIETRSADVAPGERFFGFVPMSTEFVVTPGRSDAEGVTDISPHRAGLADPYNRLRRCVADPAWRPDREELQMLLHPLFFTSYLIDDFLADQDDLGAGQVIITSASAKTSIGLAHQLHRRGQRVVGLTSVANAEFCRGLGVYDVVHPYDDLDGIAVELSLLVDVAGDWDVVRGVHGRLGDRLVHSMIVGGTHWDRAAPSGDDLPGPRPTFFFAPGHVTKRSAEWGAAGLEERIATAWEAYAEWVATWLELDRVSGPDAVTTVFGSHLSGRVDPRRGTVCTLATGEVPS